MGRDKRVRLASSSLRSKISNSQASSAGVWVRLRCACIPSASDRIRGSGAPSGAFNKITLRRQACETHLAHRGHLAFEMPRLPALHLRRFLPQGRSNSAGQTPQAFTCVVRLPLQRAGPRIRAGQLPEASRGVIASHAAGAAPAGSGFTRFRPRQVAPSKRTPLEDAPG